jgi:U3 small nucleolar RNA-associated protein 15
MILILTGVLRTFRKHQGPVRQVSSRNLPRDSVVHFHQAIFSLDNPAWLLSSSDDKTVRLFDIGSSSQVCIVGEHSDYVRALTLIPGDSNLVLSGSYDHSLSLWDLRAPGTAVRSFSHESPVESVLGLPSSALALSAGSNQLKVWDILSGRCVTTLSNHQKTITSLARSSNGSRFFSGGLDHIVKVYDSSSFDVTHSFSFQAPVLSLDFAPDNHALAAGLANGTVSLHTRPLQAGENKEQTYDEIVRARDDKAPRTGSRKYFNRGSSEQAGPLDYKAEVVKKQHLKPYDTFLKKFQYQQALNAALDTQRAVVVTAVLDELIQRGGLKIALAGRDDTTLEPFLRFLVKNVVNPHFTLLLTDVATTTLELYSSVLGQSVTIDELFMALFRRLQEETQLHQRMLALLGMLDVVATGAELRSAQPIPVLSPLPSLPSVNASSDLPAPELTASWIHHKAQTERDLEAPQPVYKRAPSPPGRFDPPAQPGVQDGVDLSTLTRVTHKTSVRAPVASNPPPQKKRKAASMSSSEIGSQPAPALQSEAKNVSGLTPLTLKSAPLSGKKASTSVVKTRTKER